MEARPGTHSIRAQEAIPAPSAVVLRCERLLPSGLSAVLCACKSPLHACLSTQVPKAHKDYKCRANCGSNERATIGCLVAWWTWVVMDGSRATGSAIPDTVIPSYREQRQAVKGKTAPIYPASKHNNSVLCNPRSDTVLYCGRSNIHSHCGLQTGVAPKVGARARAAPHKRQRDNVKLVRKLCVLDWRGTGRGC